MPFTPTNFQNSPSSATPINAAALNKLGTQHALAVTDAVAQVATDVADAESAVGSALNATYGADAMSNDASALAIATEARILASPGALTRLGGRRIGFLGDSNTAVYSLSGGGSWTDYAVGFSQGRLVKLGNIAVAGDTIEGQLDKLPTLLALNPDIIGMSIGTNNLNDADLTTQEKADYTEIVDTILAAGILPVIGLIVPKAANAARTLRANAWIRSLAQSRKVPVVDFHSILVDESTGGIRSEFDVDGTHPNVAAKHLMGQTFANTILDILPPVPVMLPTFSQAVDTDNLVNGVFLADANADGIPDGWTGQFGTGGTYTHTIVPDADIPGSWAQVALSATNAQRSLRAQVTTGLTGKITAGDRILVVGRFESEGVVSASETATGARGSVLFQINGSASEYSVMGQILTSVEGFTFANEFVAEATASSNYGIFLQNYTGDTAGATYRWAQIGVYNLTTMQALI